MARSPEEELIRAGKADQILSEPVFQDAVNAMREALIMGITQSAFVDEKLREKLCHRLALLEALLSQLRSEIETGKLAEAMLRHKSVGERIKDFIGV